MTFPATYSLFSQRVVSLMGCARSASHAKLRSQLIGKEIQTGAHELKNRPRSTIKVTFLS